LREVKQLAAIYKYITVSSPSLPSPLLRGKGGLGGGGGALTSTISDTVEIMKLHFQSAYSPPSQLIVSQDSNERLSSLYRRGDVCIYWKYSLNTL